MLHLILVIFCIMFIFILIKGVLITERIKELEKHNKRLEKYIDKTVWNKDEK